MGNNEVIIDGVIVAECVCYQKEVHTSTEIFYNHCLETNKCCGSKDNYNCYFKQLQRAKKENEKLHITIEKLKGDLYIAEDSLKDYQEHYNKLEAENEKLKAEIKELKQLKDMYFTFYKAKHDDINGTFFKFKQALEDIRESCNAYAKTEDFVIDQTFNEFFENVLNRINEVLND